MKKLLFKYILEFIVIVFGITISFYLEDYRQKQEQKSLSYDLKKNLLSEINEIEIYLQERAVAFKGDQFLLNALQQPELTLDSLIAIQTKPVMYGAVLFNYRGFTPPVSFYNSLVNDGNIRYLESDIIKKELDLMHNVHLYLIKSNIADEAIAQRKVIDYFQKKYPQLILESKSRTENKAYVKKLKKIIDADISLQSILYQKSIAVEFKVIGFDRFNNSLAVLKNALSNSLD